MKGGLDTAGRHRRSQLKVYGSEDGGFLGLSPQAWKGIAIGAGLSLGAAGLSYGMHRGLQRRAMKKSSTQSRPEPRRVFEARRSFNESMAEQSRIANARSTTQPYSVFDKRGIGNEARRGLLDSGYNQAILGAQTFRPPSMGLGDSVGGTRGGAVFSGGFM